MSYSPLRFAVAPRIAGHTDKRFTRTARRILMRRWYGYQLDTLRVRLLLRLRGRCGWRRVWRGGRRGRARAHIPYEGEGKDKCPRRGEQSISVHRLCPQFSLPHHVSPPCGSGTSQTLRAEKHNVAVRPRMRESEA